VETSARKGLDLRGAVILDAAAPTHVVGVCHVCGSEFGEGQEQVWQRHVGDCARRHMDEILAMRPSERNKGGPWDPETWDPEVDAHMREVGRRMLRERRLEVLPHERAGHA
jgi:hypothetical protein